IVALEELHRQKEGAVFQLAEVEDVEHDGVLDARGADRLLLKAGHDLGPRRELVAQDLEGDLLLDRLVLGQIDAAHTPFAEQSHQAIATSGEAPEEWILSGLHVRTVSGTAPGSV